jgi:hypothetical protein
MHEIFGFGVFIHMPENRHFVLFSAVPEIIDPVFAKTSQNARFLLSENERFGLVFVKTGSINSGTVGYSAKRFFNPVGYNAKDFLTL